MLRWPDVINFIAKVFHSRCSSSLLEDDFYEIAPFVLDGLAIKSGQEVL